jgi:hypothetical protein
VLEDFGGRRGGTAHVDLLAQDGLTLGQGFPLLGVARLRFGLASQTEGMYSFVAPDERFVMFAGPRRLEFAMFADYFFARFATFRRQLGRRGTTGGGTCRRISFHRLGRAARFLGCFRRECLRRGRGAGDGQGERREERGGPCRRSAGG